VQNSEGKQVEYRKIVKAYIPEEMRNAFKAACAKNGKSMSDVLVSFMKSYVETAEGGGSNKN